MERQQTLEQILEHLATYGFEGPELKGQIYAELSIETPTLKITNHKQYGEDLMLYELTLGREQGQGDALRLQNVQARLRKPVEIPATLISDVDPLALDRQMALIDWYHWWDPQNKDLPEGISVEPVMKGLSDLFRSREKEGIEMQQRLMYKHWPPEIYDRYRKPDGPQLDAEHESSYNFKLKEWPTFSASIAYLKLSGALNALYKETTLILDGSLGKERLWTVLLHQLKPFPEVFEIKGSHNRPESFMEFSIPIARKDNSYVVGPYSMSLKNYPELLHAVFNGVDTQTLEEKMLAVNWENETQLFHFDEEHGPQLYPAVDEIMSQLFLLGKDSNGARAADLLWLKYIQEVPFVENFIPDTAWEILEQFPEKVGTFPPDMWITKAVNLLEGSAVQYPLTEEQWLRGNDWVRISSEAESEGQFLLQPLKGPNFLQLDNMLAMLHVLFGGHKGYINKLLDGARITVETELGQNLQVQVDPDINALRVWTTEGREIPFNFHLDPDFGARLDNTVLREGLVKGAEQRSLPVKNTQRKGPSI